MTHLWEANHPYYGAEGSFEEADSFEDLKELVDSYDRDMNFVYRWDWDEAEEGDMFHVFMLCPRRENCWSVSCPVTKDQEPEIKQWLEGPRVLGYLKEVWAPFLN